MIIQLAATGFSIFALAVTHKRFREGKLSQQMLILWSVMWLGIIVFVLAPDKFSSLSAAIGIKRPLDFMLTAGLVLVAYLNFRLYIHMEDMRKNLAVITRQAALLEEKTRD